MKILLCSYAFAPSLGGIETVSQLLAEILVQRGHDVTLVTSTPGSGGEEKGPFSVVRRPGIRRLISEISRADLVLQSNISLQLGWPLWVFYLHKPFVVVHHTPIARPDGTFAWQDRLKRGLLWRPYCLSVSNFLAGTMSAKSQWIPIPYNSTVFRKIPGVQRSGDLLFVGRLVSAKGADILLRAFEKVLKGRPQSTLSIVGSGPERERLEQLAGALGVAQNVSFLGPKRAGELAEVMNAHKILVVPSRSRPPEACPAVPIEALACGCVPVASRMGGLPESVGEAGVLFEEGNVEELARILLRLLDSPDQIDAYLAKAESHIRQFQLDAVADAYEFHLAACRR
jgi:glycosyltransferase involved in cell wall biosynthesis